VTREDQHGGDLIEQVDTRTGLPVLSRRRLILARDPVSRTGVDRRRSGCAPPDQGCCQAVNSLEGVYGGVIGDIDAAAEICKEGGDDGFGALLGGVVVQIHHTGCHVGRPGDRPQRRRRHRLGGGHQGGRGVEQLTTEESPVTASDHRARPTPAQHHLGHDP
jgi:hypothetical protein